MLSGSVLGEKIWLQSYASDVDWVVSCPSPLEKTAAEGNRQPRRLAYFDGLRGVAAVSVYMLHFQVFNRSSVERACLENSWGYNGQYHFAALPFIRTFFMGGHYGVTIFLVMSGYVLSYTPLRYIHARNTVRLHDNLSSALLRRFLRLWIPVIVTTFLFMSSWHLFGIRTQHPQAETFSIELLKWYDNIRSSSFHYTTVYFNDYNFHVWTIPLEFRGSITVYTTLVALQNVPKNKRLFCQLLLIWYFVYITDGWYCALFVAGMLLCDLDLLADHGESPSIFERFQRVPGWIFHLLMVLGIYLGGVPCNQKSADYLRGSLGWHWLSYTVPRAMDDFRWWFRGWAAILTIATVPRIRHARSLLESDVCQYLGKISYAFYLIHGHVLYTLGDRLYAVTGRIGGHHAELMPQWINWLPLPSWGPLGMELNHIAPHLILFPFTIWLADLTTRLVDEPTVKFCRWLQDWLLDGD